MLLVVSLGLNVVRDSLGKAMLKCRLLAAAHFVFGRELHSNSVRILETSTIFSPVCRRHRGIAVGVDLCASALTLRDPSRFHTKWLPYLHHVCTEWSVMFIYIRNGRLMMLYSYDHPPSRTQTTLQTQNVSKAVLYTFNSCCRRRSVLCCLLIFILGATR